MIWIIEFELLGLLIFGGLCTGLLITVLLGLLSNYYIWIINCWFYCVYGAMGLLVIGMVGFRDY